MEPARFGPYLLDGELGRGPSGVVHRARDTSHGGRTVALKILDARLSADPAFRARFRRDVDVLAAVREPHVVPVHASGEIGGRLYVDMRLVRGTSLAAELARGPLPAARAGELAGQLRSAQESLSRGGFAPRRIDPADVLLTGGADGPEFVQLVGLGLGRAPADPAELPDLGTLVGASGPARVGGAGRRRRWPITVAVLAVVAIGVTALVVAIRPGRPAGPLTTLASPGGTPLAAAVTVLDGAPAVVTLNAGGRVAVLGLDGRPVRPPPPGGASSVAVADVAGRPALLVGVDGQTLHLYDLGDGAAWGEPFGTGVTAPDTLVVTGDAWIVADSPEGPLALAFELRDEGSVLQAYRLPGGEPTGRPVDLPFNGGYSDVVPGGPARVVSVAAGTVAVRDALTGTAVAGSVPVAGVVTGLAVVAGPTGLPLAVLGTNDGTVRVVDTSDPAAAPLQLTGLDRPVTAVRTVPSGDRTLVIATGDRGGPRTCVWDLATGELLVTFDSGPLAAGFLAAAPDGSLLVGTDEAGTGFTVWRTDMVLAGGRSG